MGFFKKIVMGQCIDVIEWKDDSKDTMVYRFGDGSKEIMMGAQLTVRESQAAIFVNEGQIADVFMPGRYELNTQNMPIMTALRSWKFGFNSPFKSEVYFVNTRQFMDMKWGTTNPVMMRDADFGIIRLRAFGIYAFRVSDPKLFLKEAFGTSKLYSTSDVEGQLKRIAVSALSDAIAECKIPALDLASNYDELGELAMQRITPKIQPIGLTLTSFTVENISLPEEVEKAMDRRTSMGVVGDLNKYTQFQAAESMRDAANNPAGGMAGMGVGMGAGMVMNSVMQNSMNASAQPAAQPAAAAAFCPSCGNGVNAGAKFCPSCGAKIGAAGNVCSGCGASVDAGAKFCPSCGQKQ